MDRLDSYRCAKLLLDRHGDDAPVVAALRTDELDELGDHVGRRAWMAVIAAIDELSRTVRRASERLQ